MKADIKKGVVITVQKEEGEWYWYLNEANGNLLEWGKAKSRVEAQRAAKKAKAAL